MTTVTTVNDLVGVMGVTSMSSKYYQKHRSEILPRLRARNDPPPRLMRVGTGEREKYHANLRAEIERHGGSVVRGFKLYKFRMDKAIWKTASWRAMVHMVVATVSPSGTTVYTDPNREDADADEYIFVPSARAHPELTDEQLLSGDWFTGGVVGGVASFCARFIAHERLHGRSRSVIAYTPEDLRAKPVVVMRLPPHFAEWHRLSGHTADVDTLAEMMGATVFPIDAAPEDNAEIDAVRALAESANNTEACVNGMLGIKLELKCTKQLMSGELSVPEARRLFFSHYDNVYSTVRAEQTRRFNDWSSSWGQLEHNAVQSFL